MCESSHGQGACGFSAGPAALLEHYSQALPAPNTNKGCKIKASNIPLLESRRRGSSSNQVLQSSSCSGSATARHETRIPPKTPRPPHASCQAAPPPHAGSQQESPRGHGPPVPHPRCRLSPLQQRGRTKTAPFSPTASPLQPGGALPAPAGAGGGSGSQPRTRKPCTAGSSLQGRRREHSSTASPARQSAAQSSPLPFDVHESQTRSQNSCKRDVKHLP